MESLNRNKIVFCNSVVCIFLAAFLVGCGNDKPDAPADPPVEKPAKVTPVIPYKVVNRFPHDITAYTEGFLFHDGKLFESTGATNHLPQTRSAIGIVDLKTGKFDTKVEIDKEIYFGEGIVVLKNKLYQLTYKNQIGFIYNVKNFHRLGQFGYLNKEGWGMTTEGTHLIMSDGTCNITYLEPDSFSVTRILPVLENGYGLYSLNELEYINGFIYANVWMTNRIVKIDPQSGEVVGSLDLSALYNESRSRDINLNELNGIAYDPANDRILVTGKLWPDIYEISFAH